MRPAGPDVPPDQHSCRGRRPRGTRPGRPGCRRPGLAAGRARRLRDRDRLRAGGNRHERGSRRADLRGQRATRHQSRDRSCGGDRTGQGLRRRLARCSGRPGPSVLARPTDACPEPPRLIRSRFRRQSHGRRAVPRNGSRSDRAVGPATRSPCGTGRTASTDPPSSLADLDGLMTWPRGPTAVGLNPRSSMSASSRLLRPGPVRGWNWSPRSAVQVMLLPRIGRAALQSRQMAVHEAPDPVPHRRSQGAGRISISQPSPWSRLVRAPRRRMFPPPNTGWNAGGASRLLYDVLHRCDALGLRAIIVVAGPARVAGCSRSLRASDSSARRAADPLTHPLGQYLNSRRGDRTKRNRAGGGSGVPGGDKPPR